MRTSHSLFIALIAGLAFFATVGNAAAIDIASIDDLQKIGNDPAYPLNGSYVLTQDIDATVTATWNAGAGFAPIQGFTGIFGGQGHVITNVVINRPGEDTVGLFGTISGGGEIRNLGIEGGMVSGRGAVGALVGNNQDGVLSNCYATGSVLGSTSDIGGLAGWNSGMVSACYSTGAVTGGEAAGGLVGNNMGTVSNSHASGAVAGGWGTGGLVGHNEFGTLTDSYATGAVSCDDAAGGLVGWNDGMVSISYATGDVSGSNWNIGGLVGGNRGVVSSSHAEGAVSGNESTGGLTGTNEYGTVWDCFATGMVSGVNSTGGLVGNNDNGIVSSSHAEGAVSGNDSTGGLVGWNTGSVSNSNATGDVLSASYSTGGLVGANDPLGTITGSYATGSVSGSDSVGGLAGWNGGAVADCSAAGIVSGDSYNAGGLVGTNDQGGTVTDSHATGSVSGNVSVGGLVGWNGGAVSNSHATGEVSGGEGPVGGLVGANDGGTVSNSLATGMVSGDTSIGGLVGHVGGGTVSNCYAVGAVSGNDAVGGLAGGNYGTVSNSYAIGAVSGHISTGGLVGWNEGTVTASFWNTETSGLYRSAGGTGLSIAQMMQQSTFSDAGWDFAATWTMQEGATVPYHPGDSFAGGVFALSVSGTNGTVSISPSPEGETYIGGSLVQLIATPDTGYYFVGWHRTDIPDGLLLHVNPLSIMVTGDVAYEAVFDVAIPIGTIEELQLIGSDPAYPLDGNYVLTQDIDASITATWNSGAGFEPIGSDYSQPEGEGEGESPAIVADMSFTGTFNGQGHVIAGLTINHPSEYNAGLFGTLGAGGDLRNLGIEDGAVSGNGTVGGLVGNNQGGTVTNCHATGAVSGSWGGTGGLIGSNERGTVTNCYATGTVTGGLNGAGGLAGDNFEGTIVNCYATGAISGGFGSGGLVAYNFSGTVTNCYATGVVSASVGSTGGLVGYNLNGTVTASFWNTETSGQDTSEGGTGLTRAQMQTRSTFTDAGWDFVAVWEMVDGVTLPYHWGASFAGGTFAVSAAGSHGSVSISPPGGTFTGGSLVTLTATQDTGYAFAGWQGPGIPDGFPLPVNPFPVMATDDAAYEAVFLVEGPITIGSIDALQLIGRDLEHPLHWDYVLSQDIDASITTTWNSGAGFAPIGATSPFTGVFDGQGHSINGLVINWPGEMFIGGLFSTIGEGGEVRNLGIDVAELSSMRYFAGSLAGINGGAVTGCYATGAISGLGYTGGLVGANVGTMTDCSATGPVSGGFSGGITGFNAGGTLKNCYATGAVSASDEGEGMFASVAGGLVGYNSDGTVEGSYATGDVSVSSSSTIPLIAGGLVGYVVSGAVADCYAAGAISVSAPISGEGEGEATFQAAAGGLAGQNDGAVTNCYASGAVSISGSKSIAGGLVAYAEGGTATASFWDMQTSGQIASAGGTGLITAQMKQASIFVSAGWDFTNVWAMSSEGEGYPILLMGDPPDTDGDGMPDAYEALYPGALNPSVNDANADADGDGLSNLLEYQLGSSPVEPRAPLPVIYVDGASGSDASGDGTESNPYQTIQHAIDSVNTTTGSVRIAINPGVYTEDVALKSNITLSKAPGEVRILGTLAGAANCVVEGVTIEAVSSATPLVRMLDVVMTLRDVVLTGASFRPDTGLEITGVAAKDSVLEHVTFTSFGTCLHINGAIPKVRRCIFENFANAAIVVETSAGKAGDTGGLGDLSSAESGWNTFRDYDAAQFAVVNDSGIDLKMQNNDWSVYTYDEIKTKVSMKDGSDVKPEDVEPFAAKNAGILAGSIYCAVMDGKTLKSVLNASVSLPGSAYTPVSENVNGVYAFPAVGSGTYSLAANAANYVPGATFLEVAANAQTALTMLLAQQPPPPGEGEHNGNVKEGEGQDEGEGEGEPSGKARKFLWCGVDKTESGGPLGDAAWLAIVAMGLGVARRRVLQ